MTDETGTPIVRYLVETEDDKTLNISSQNESDKHENETEASLNESSGYTTGN